MLFCIYIMGIFMLSNNRCLYVNEPFYETYTFRYRPPIRGGYQKTSMESEAFEMEIAQKIQRLRIEAGISDEQMAEAIGYNTKVLSAIETGNRSIGVKTLIKYADAVGKKLIIDFV